MHRVKIRRIIILLIIFSITMPLVSGCDQIYKNSYNNDFELFYQNPNNVTIYLDKDRSTYGQELLWIANTTGTNYEESAVVYIDGTAYISSCSTHGDGHDRLFAVNTTNGKILWNKFIGPGYVGPVIDNDMIYIGTSSHGHDPSNEYVYAINRHDGSELWNKNIYGGIPESIQFDKNNIYFTTDLIYALDKKDGSIIWTYRMDSFSVTKPLLKDGFFYTATSGGSMYKIDVNDGSRIWEVTLSDFSWDNSITADGNGNIFLALYGDRTINAYDEDDGSLIWSYLLHGASLSFNAYHDNMLFISDTKGYVYAFNASTGSLIWENKIGNTIDISSPTLSGRLLFIGTRDFDEGAFFALDYETGKILWKYTIGASVTAPPSITDGMMLCGTDGWYMYAFDFGIGSGNWTLSRYDKSNTAYSPEGLKTWQYVEANCSTYMNITYCNVTNFYDHDVSNVLLMFESDFITNWYDTYGNLLKQNSNNYTIDNLSSLSSIHLVISRISNSPPIKPIINGSTSGRPGIEYEYTFSSIDPDGDNIYYIIDWGDNSLDEMIGPYISGDMVKAKHIWGEQGIYRIRAKTKDNFGFESDWAFLTVSMPKNYDLLSRFPLFEKLFNNIVKNIIH